MRNKSSVFILVLMVASFAQAENKFTTFMKSCGYGALAGAGIGLVSLAIENRPSQHFDNVARGASLGLYVGIGYGIFEVSKKPDFRFRQDFDYSSDTILVPKWNQQAHLDGVEVQSKVYSF